MYQIDTSNVLFILSGAFVGLDNIIKRRVAKGASLALFHFKNADLHLPRLVHWIHSGARIQ
jgi:ATP-dependent protease Clp ATPase subunit